MKPKNMVDIQRHLIAVVSTTWNGHTDKQYCVDLDWLIMCTEHSGIAYNVYNVTQYHSKLSFNFLVVEALQIRSKLMKMISVKQTSSLRGRQIVWESFYFLTHRVTVHCLYANQENRRQLKLMNKLFLLRSRYIKWK